MKGYSSSSLTFLFTTTTILLLLIIFHHIQPAVASSKTLKPQYDRFIATSCKTSTFPYLCYTTLSPSAAYIQTDPWKLCNAALSATIKASGAVSTAVSRLTREKGLTPREAAVIKDCQQNVRSSIGELQQSLQALADLRRGRGIEDQKFQMANIKTWLSAAITDETTCTDGFHGGKVSARVKKQITTAISRFSKLSSNALALVNHQLS